MFPDVNGMISCDVIHGLTFLLAADSMLMDLKMALGESHQQDVHADGYKLTGLVFQSRSSAVSGVQHGLVGWNLTWERGR